MTETASSATSSRRHDMDALRAFAMLSGIVLHASLSFCPLPWPVQDTRQHEAFGLLLAFLHGFRMPLFFLMSGFFTAMLWRKRGLKSLLWHRCRRIVFPLLIGMVTIVPVMWVVSGIAITTGSNQASASESAKDTDADIWTAVRAGDVEAIQRHIASGAELNGHDRILGQTPLTLAALVGQTEAVDLLLQEGADVNALTRDGNTALHYAAFFGHADIAERALQNGALTNIRNNHGQTPSETLAVDWAMTQFIAGMLKIDLDKEEVLAGRKAIGEFLGDTDPDESQEPKAQNVTELKRGLVNLWRILQAFPFFHHLWFLWFLCWLVAGFAIYAAIADWLVWKGPSGWLFLSPARYLWLIPLTLIPQSYASMSVFGPDTSAGLIPMFHVLFYYAIFFGFGALYYDTGDKTGRVGSRYWLTLPITVFLVFPLGIEFTHGGFGIRDWIAPAMHRPLGNVLQIAFAWLMTFGCMGLFRRLLSRESATIRYLSDSAYWLYLVHLPLIMGAQAIVRNWPLPALVKLVLITAVGSGFLLLTYQLFVRYTPIGTLLNGRRTRHVKKTP